MTGPLAPRVVVAAPPQIIKKGARLRRRLCRRVASLRSGATALRAEGGGIALTGDEYKVSVTGFAFSVIWQNNHSADWLAALASPYPASPDFPLFRGQKKGFLRWTGPLGRRVLKFDGLAGRGLWWRLRRSFKKKGRISSGEARFACFPSGESPVVKVLS